MKIKNIKKLIMLLSFLLMIIMIFSACAGDNGDTQNALDTSGEIEGVSNSETDDLLSDYDTDSSYDAVSSAKITFSSDMAEIDGAGVLEESYGILITSPGSYILSGEGYGTVIIRAGDTDKVKLVLSGLNLTSTDDAAIIVENADKVVITLADGTTNILTDGSSYDPESMANGCLFSKDDLTINGGGSLEVKGNFNNGIVCKDDLKIVSGNITVSSVGNAIKGNDSVVIAGGKIDVVNSEDGIKAKNETDATKGYVVISGGELNIKAADDAIQGITLVSLSSCSVTVEAGDDPINCDGEVKVGEGCLKIK